MKHIFFLLLFCFIQNSTNAADTNDYSKLDSSLVSRYTYISPQEQARIIIEQNPEIYFNAKIENPKTYYIPNNRNKANKYQNLLYDNQATNQGCWEKAAKAYNLDPWLLLAVAKVESGFNKNAININKDSQKSIDTGMMQINSFWLPTLNKFGISKNDLYNPCTSVFVGAWIMAQNIKNFGYNKDGIGAYNAPNNITKRRIYAEKVYTAYQEITHDLYYSKMVTKK